MTPNDLEVLIHYYSIQGPHPKIDAPAVKESIEEFLVLGILKPTKTISAGTQTDLGMYDVTTKGRAWLSMILNTPHPKQVWVDQNGNIIMDNSTLALDV